MQGGVLQNLDGDGLLILRVIAFAAVHRAHAAVTENGHDAIGPHAGADEPVLVILQQRFRRFTYGVQQRVLGPSIRLQQAIPRRAQLQVVAAGSRQVGGAFAGAESINSSNSD